MRIFRHIALGLALLGAAPAVPRPAQAQEPSTELPADNVQRARAAFADGNAAYLEGRYRDAIAHFDRANTIAPNPRLLEYIGRCYLNLSDYAGALRSYRAYADSSAEAAAEVAELLQGLQRDATISATYKASDNVNDALARANGETPPPRDLRRQELGTLMRDVTVQIRTTPRGADVFIDAIELGSVGQTPLETPLFTGRHFVEVRREHYAPQNRVINVTIPGPGESIPVVEFTLERLQVPTEVTVAPATARAAFLSDDGTRVDMGIGGWQGTLPAGPGAFVLQHAGRDRRIEHVVQAGDDGVARIALSLDDGPTAPRAEVRLGRVIVVVSGLEGAQVLVNGRPIGTTPGTVEAELTAGTHTVEIAMEGFETWRQDIDVTGGAEVRVYGPSTLNRARRR